MEGNRPKRRKDKYNPYTIFEKDGQGALHSLRKTASITFHSKMDKVYHINLKSARRCMTRLILLN